MDAFPRGGCDLGGGVFFFSAIFVSVVVVVVVVVVVPCGCCLLVPVLEVPFVEAGCLSFFSGSRPFRFVVVGCCCCFFFPLVATTAVFLFPATAFCLDLPGFFEGALPDDKDISEALSFSSACCCCCLACLLLSWMFGAAAAVICSPLLNFPTFLTKFFTSSPSFPRSCER